MGLRVIDEKCLSDKFRRCRGTGGRAPVALVIRRIGWPLPVFLRRLIIEALTGRSIPRLFTLASESPPC